MKCNKTIKYLIIVLFIIVLLTLLISILFFRRYWPKSESTTSTEQTSSSEEYNIDDLITKKEGSAIVNLAFDFDSDTDNFDDAVSSWENPIPIITDYSTFADQYNIPKAYIFNEELNSSSFKYQTTTNSYGMKFVDNISWSVTGKNNGPTSACEINDQKCSSIRSIELDSAFIQYKFKDLNESNSSNFQITYWRNMYDPKMDSITSGLRNLIIVRLLDGWGEGYKYYSLGRINLDMSANTTWENGWLYIWVIDEDKVLDENSVYVFDYILEDNYKRAYTHTVRGTKNDIEQNYHFIAFLLENTGSEKYYTSVMTATYPFESEKQKISRLELYASDITQICNEIYGNKCNTYYTVEENPLPSQNGENKYYIKQNFKQNETKLDDSLSDERTLIVKICDDSDNGQIWKIADGISSFAEIRTAPHSECLQKEFVISNFEGTLNIYTVTETLKPGASVAVQEMKETVFSKEYKSLFHNKEKVTIEILYKDTGNFEIK